MQSFTVTRVCCTVVVFCLILPACGGDDHENPAAAGAGGGGDGGTSGSPSATSGNPATGGSATASGGTGGTSATTAGGTGGAAGEAGAGGEGGDRGEAAVTDRSCHYGCSSDDDCATASAEVRSCHRGLGLCVECTEHADCTARASAWIFSCSEQSPCLFDSEVCVNVGNSGYCAELAVDSACDFGEPVQAREFGSDDPVEVCGSSAGRCKDYRCFTGCTSDSDCSDQRPGLGDTCDLESGECTCQSDDECFFGPGRCDSATERCAQCETDSDCAGIIGGQACMEGRCACSSASECPDTLFPQAALACQ